MDPEYLFEEMHDAFKSQLDHAEEEIECVKDDVSDMKVMIESHDGKVESILVCNAETKVMMEEIKEGVLEMKSELDKNMQAIAEFKDMLDEIKEGVVAMKDEFDKNMQAAYNEIHTLHQDMNDRLIVIEPSSSRLNISRVLPSSSVGICMPNADRSSHSQNCTIHGRIRKRLQSSFLRALGGGGSPWRGNS
jgi:histidinol dehydrogenase